MSLDIQSVSYSAYISPSIEDDAGSVSVDSATGDVVLCDGRSDSSRFSFDSVAYHPFHATVYESTLSHRVSEAFGGGACAASSAHPRWMHGAVVHGSPSAHSAELFRSLVLSAVGDALGVAAAARGGPVQLQYSMVRVYSWGVTDLLNQRVVESRQHDAGEECSTPLQRNVIAEKGDAVLENVLRAALQRKENESPIVFTLSIHTRDFSSTCPFTITLFPHLSERQLDQSDIHALRMALEQPSPEIQLNGTLQHLFPVPQVLSFVVITCLSSHAMNQAQNRHNCFYGSRVYKNDPNCVDIKASAFPLTERQVINTTPRSGKSVSCTNIQSECDGNRVRKPSSASSAKLYHKLEERVREVEERAEAAEEAARVRIFSAKESEILFKRREVELQERLRDFEARVSLAEASAGRRLSILKEKEEAAKRREAEIEERIREMEDRAITAERAAGSRFVAAKEKEEAARRLESILEKDLDAFRAELTELEERIKASGRRERLAAEKESILLQRVRELTIEQEELVRAKDTVQTVMCNILEGFEESIGQARCCENNMFSSIDRAEEYLRISDSDAIAREVIANRRICSMIESFQSISMDHHTDFFFSLLNTYKLFLENQISFVHHLTENKVDLLFGSLINRN